MSQAVEVPNAINITSVHLVSGTVVLETDCHDYDHYKSLPAVVKYDGRECSKTGWNSDRNIACYQSGRPIAKAV